MSTTETGGDRPTITQFTDPMCTWSWGSEPIVRRLRVVYGEQIQVEYVMGGLVEDFDEFYDAANDISEPSDVAPHWLEASERHGMPVNTDIFASNPAQSTYPASVAAVAARQQGTDPGQRYLRRLREAYITEARNVNERAQQVDLARSVGLDVEQFTTALDDGTARAGFEADLARTRNAGVTGFPTYRIAGPDGERQLAGFRSFPDLADTLTAVAPSVERTSPPPLRTFVADYDPVATREVAEVYELSRGKARQTLAALAERGALSRDSRGNGLFWHAESVD